MFFAPLAGLLLFQTQSKSPLGFPPEYKLDYEYASLLLSGESGVRELLRRLDSKDVRQRSMASSILLDSGERRFLPRLIEFWTDDEISYVSMNAIVRNMDAAWPILLEKARAGEPRAVERIGWYGARSEPIIEELSGSDYPAVRAEVLKRLSRKRMEEALSDPDQRVVDVAVHRLYNVYQESDESLEKLYFHPNPRVRTAATMIRVDDEPILLDWFVRLAKDPDERVREAALLQIGRFGKYSSRRHPIHAGALAVEQGLNGKSKGVKSAAVWAVRGWTDEWTKLPKRWMPEDLAIGRRILLRADVRNVLYQESQKRIDSYGEIYRGLVSTPPAIVSLAISGDPRLFVSLKAAVQRQRGLLGRSDFMDTFAYVPVSRSWSYLLNQVESLARKPLVFDPSLGASGGEDPFFGMMSAMGRFNPKGNVDPLLPLAMDRKRKITDREFLLRGLAIFYSNSVLQYIEKVANDTTEPQSFRQNAVRALVDSPNPRAQQVLKRLEKNSPDPVIRTDAHDVFELLKSKS
ncbi:hypothetical protein EON81_10330 [bacterium]|nr:MAG: hypothetical protein EON81_10330 [bacterium]